MKYLSSLVLSLLIVFAGDAQMKRPMINLSQPDQDKFDFIKLKMYGIVKAFGKDPRTGGGSTHYDTDLRIGKSFILVSEDERSEKLDINFTGTYYTGTKDDFLKFYQQVVDKIKSMLAATHTPDEEKIKEKYRQYTLYENDKDWSDSPTSIYITYDCYQETSPVVSVQFYHKKN